MRSSSSVGLGLSLVFGCLLLALVAELYYLLWWKKKTTSQVTFQQNYMFCWKKPSSLTTDTQVHEPQTPNKHTWLRPFNQSQHHDHTIIDSEVLRLQNLSIPPRFLFTIKEETNEDLESNNNTPFFTPMASPPYLTPEYSYRAFSPLFESSSDTEFNRIWASPPPKFKFLRDAEDKLQRKILERFDDDDGVKDEENGSFITLIVPKNKEIEG